MLAGVRCKTRVAYSRSFAVRANNVRCCTHPKTYLCSPVGVVLASAVYLHELELRLYKPNGGSVDGRFPNRISFVVLGTVRLCLVHAVTFLVNALHQTGYPYVCRSGVSLTWGYS